MRLIDADALDKMLMDAQAVSKEKGGNFRCGVIGSVRENIRMMPTVEPERKKGHWQPYKFGDDTWHQCSVCGIADRYIDIVARRVGPDRRVEFTRNFCPICGADMRGEQE